MVNPNLNEQYEEELNPIATKIGGFIALIISRILAIFSRRY